MTERLCDYCERVVEHPCKSGYESVDCGHAPTLTHPPAAALPDNWRQYAKDGETAQACIERHRIELAEARAVTPKPVAVVKQGAAFGPPEFRAKVKRVDLLVDPASLEAGTILYVHGSTK